MARRSALENSNRLDQLEALVQGQMELVRCMEEDIAEMGRLVKALAGPKKLKPEPAKSAEG